MDLMSLSKQMLKDAVTTGIIHLSTGEYKELTTSQILSIARYIVKEGLLIQDEVTLSANKHNAPSEMFTVIPINNKDDSCIIEVPSWKENLISIKNRDVFIEEDFNG